MPQAHSTLPASAVRAANVPSGKLNSRMCLGQWVLSFDLTPAPQGRSSTLTRPPRWYESHGGQGSQRVMLCEAYLTGVRDKGPS